MIFLLLACLHTAPLAQWTDETVCWSGSCGPRVVNLGFWNPVEFDYHPMTEYEATH